LVNSKTDLVPITKIYFPYTGEATPQQIKEYQELMGATLHIYVAGKPEIGFAIANLSRFTQNPSYEHWQAL
jgi:hypothetical protein